MAEIGCGMAMAGGPGPLIAELPAIAGLREDTWQAVLNGSQVVHYPAGSKLIRYDKPVERLMIVLGGVIKVYETASNGREITLYRIHGGQICALSLTRMLHGSAQCAQAIAEEDVRLLSVPRELFDQLITESQGFRDYLMQAMAHRLTDLMKLTAEISFHNLDLRLAHLIRRLSCDETTIKLQLTHQEIANELGTTREVISRLLKDFEKSGCIKLGRGNIQILAIDKLNQICDQPLKQQQLGI